MHFIYVSSPHSISIEDDIRELENWEKIWLLRFNASKCKVLHIDLNNNPYYEYYLNGTKLGVSEQEKDLGVITSPSLLWNEQIKASIAKANKNICWIARNLITREKKVMIAIYKALIRPHLEYCVQLWNPVAEHGNWSLILELEGVQRRFTRLIDEVGILPYSERLDILRLTTLAERRSRGDLIETFKALNGISCVGKLFNTGRSGLHLVSKIQKQSSKVGSLQRDFLPERIIGMWNKLPIEVKMAESVNSFKIRLEKFKRDNCDVYIDSGNFWEVSDTVLSKIEGPSYITNKAKHNEYLKENPYAAKKLFINLK